MAEEITDCGAEIHTGCAVRRIRRVDGGLIRLDTPDAFLEARAVITCGGVYSDRLARMTGGAESPRIVPFRGRYYALVPQASNLVRGLVYPVPDPAFPFLGVHFTKQISGEMWAGPKPSSRWPRGLPGETDRPPRCLGHGFVPGLSCLCPSELAHGLRRAARRRLAARLRRSPAAPCSGRAGGAPREDAQRDPRPGARP